MQYSPNSVDSAESRLDKEHVLPGGNVNSGVVRVGNTVRRKTTPASPTIHHLLLHLEENTYDILVEQELLDMVAEVLACMGDERQMRQMVGDAAANRLEKDGHLAHWQRQARSFERHRAWIEDNLRRM